VDACIGGELEDPIPGRRYVLGVDLAKHRDFTVLIVVDMDSWRVVAFDRFQKLDWPSMRRSWLETWPIPARPAALFKNMLTFLDEQLNRRSESVIPSPVLKYSLKAATASWPKKVSL